MMRPLSSVRPILALTMLAVGAASACGGDEAVAPPDDLYGGGTDDAGTPPEEDSGPDGGAPAGTPCTADEQCEAKCVGGACTEPSHSDGKRSPSLGETDVDCGGPTGPNCADGKTCAADDDCANGVCSAAKKCVTGTSCRGGANGTSGIETCGTAEPGTPGAVVESCCRSLPLPVRKTRRLDRYEITAGRLRAFVDAVAGAKGGVRGYAKTYATANPDSQLADVVTKYPGLVNVLPDSTNPNATFPLPVHLGVFPLDAMNKLDGCFVGPGSYGHPTYWQAPAVLKTFGAGAADGSRAYTREVLDAKPANCVMPLLFAAFCAWDGGELARTQDYHEIWGRNPVKLGTTTVFVPWKPIRKIGEFNWRNGHGAACGFPWPGCVNPQPYHQIFPTAGHDPANDDTPAIGAPGRFSKDHTSIVSASGEGWFDIGGNLLEAAWPNGSLGGGENATNDVCDTSGTGGPGAGPCTRADGRPGVIRYDGPLPHIAMMGYSFEGHARYNDKYLGSLQPDPQAEALLENKKPVTFQYGKVGARCARPSP